MRDPVGYTWIGCLQIFRKEYSSLKLQGKNRSIDLNNYILKDLKM